MDNSEVLPALNEAWCEAILSTELTPEERSDVQINLETWQDEWNADLSLAIAKRMPKAYRHAATGLGLPTITTNI